MLKLVAILDHGFLFVIDRSWSWRRDPKIVGTLSFRAAARMGALVRCMTELREMTLDLMELGD